MPGGRHQWLSPEHGRESFDGKRRERPTGDSSYLGAAQRNANEALGAINATYEQLSEIATAYGAQVPRSVIE